VTFSVLAAAAEAPETAALVVGARTISFSELAERVRRLLPLLAERGLPAPGERPAALVGVSNLETLSVLYACFELGEAVALIHPRLTESERGALVAEVKPSCVLNPAELVAASAETRAFLPSPSTNEGGVARPPDSLRSLISRGRPDRRCGTTGGDGPELERPLAILFTSGTTGRPKGVVLSRRAFLAAARGSEANLGFHEHDRWLLGLPIAHVGGLSILTRCLLARRTVVVPGVVAAGGRLDAARLAEVIESERVTLVSLVPTQLEWLLERTPAWVPPPHLRAVLLGGAAARPALLARAADRGVPVVTTYGLTEACSQVATQPYGTVNRGELGVGQPVPGVEVRIVDGAIRIRGPTLLSGYFPDEGSPATDGDGWLATDDLGRIDDRGYLHVLGRRSDLVITGGENVFPLEVEAVLERVPGIRTACAFGVPDDTWGEVVAAALVASRAERPSDAELAAFVRAELAPYRRPRLVAWVEDVITTPAGKLDRRGTAAVARSLLRRLDV
jgi:O-succinylbenzoic acid--CoA ligase